MQIWTYTTPQIFFLKEWKIQTKAMTKLLIIMTKSEYLTGETQTDESSRQNFQVRTSPTIGWVFAQCKTDNLLCLNFKSFQTVICFLFWNQTKDFNQNLKHGFILRYFDAKVNYSFLNYFFPSYSVTCFHCSRTLFANGLDIHKKHKDLFRLVIQIQRDSMDLCWFNSLNW